MLIAELDVPVHKIADRLHARPSGRACAEALPGNLAELVGLAISAAEQVDER
jgi:hypothetical protein